MSLVKRISDETITAMKARNKERVKILRSLSAAFKQVVIDKKKELTDAEALEILSKQLKQRKESFEQYLHANRNDLVEVEKYQMQTIAEFMPAELNETELEQIVNSAIVETNATSIKDMGKIMQIVKPQVLGRCDISMVSSKIKAAISTK